VLSALSGIANMAAVVLAQVMAAIYFPLTITTARIMPAQSNLIQNQSQQKTLSPKKQATTRCLIEATN
jgi:hypothetical protein